MENEKLAQPLDAAERVIRFIERVLVHTKGRFAGKPFELAPWQKEGIFRPLFGTLNEDGTRQYRTAIVGMPRKNGKSQIAAGIALSLLVNDDEPGAEIYSAAADKEQARLVFAEAKRIREYSPFLMKHTRAYRDAIAVPETHSVYRVLSADAVTKHGLNPHGVILDEFHAQPNRELWDVLTSAQGTRTQPLTFGITTAGHDQESICFEQYDYGRKIAAGLIDDPTFFFYWLGAAKEDDWTSPEIWSKANPALGDFLSLAFLESEYRKAKEIAARQNTFRQLYLNQWVQQSTRYIDLGIWDENSDPDCPINPSDLTALHGRTAFGALDLSSVSDTTAWIMLLPRESGKVDIVARFWVPEAQLDKSKNRDLYRVWKEQGYLQTTPGNAIDYDFITAQILEDAEKFNLVDMNIDRLFQGQQVAMRLSDNGLTVFPMGQGFMSFAAPMKEFERLLMDRQLNHGQNPILRWQADNVVVKMDPAGNLKPDKAGSQEKIDGIVSLIMGIDRLSRHEGPSAYESRGLLTLE